MKRPLPARYSAHLFLLLFLLLAGAAAHAQTDPLSWVNGIRRAAGSPDLVPDALLSRTAERWAMRLARTGVLSHRGADGSSALDRYRALGGTEIRVGEILGAGPSLREVENAWRKSDEHREVALTPGWTHVGWGRQPSGGQEVWVVLFCQKLVEELRIDERTAGLAVSGRFVEASAERPSSMRDWFSISPSPGIQSPGDSRFRCRPRSRDTFGLAMCSPVELTG